MHANISHHTMILDGEDQDHDVSLSCYALSLADTLLHPAGGDDGEGIPIPGGLGFTENGRACHLETGSKCLDFFFHAIQGVSLSDFQKLLAEAWDEDSATALRLVFQCGNCRKEEGGKSCYVLFIRGLLWIWREGGLNGQKSIVRNLAEIAR